MYKKISEGNYHTWHFNFKTILRHFILTIKGIIKNNVFDTLFHAGCFADSIGLFDLAYLCFTEAKKYIKNSDELEVNIATLSIIVNQDFNRAKDIYENYLITHGYDDGILYWLGCVYIELGDLQKAHDCFVRIKPESEYYNGALVRLGSIYEEKNDKCKAKQYYLAAISKNNSDYFASLGLARLELEEGNLDDARRWLIKAKSIWKKGPEVNSLLKLLIK